MSDSQNNPFANFYKMFDANQMGSFYNSYKNTSISDVNNLAEMQKENLKTLNKAMQIVSETAQKMVNNSVEMVQDYATNFHNLMRSSDLSNPNEVFTRQAEMLRHNIEKFANYTQDIGKTMCDSGAEISSSLGKRATECMEDVVSCTANQANQQNNFNNHNKKKN